MENTYCVIMAGGVGSRFWPMSTTEKPKQFLDILGVGRSLLQQTFDRFLPICKPEHIIIVTNELYKDLVLEQLPEIGEDQVLLEPHRRNTAPCIAYANYRILKQNPEANIIVAPADHLILNQQEFLRIINEGLRFVQDKDVLLTLGIKPSRPETGYGYIQMNSEEVDSSVQELRKVKTFTEKPNLEMAKVFLDSGDFYWNSGLFIWSLKSINKAFKANLQEVDSLFDEIYDKIGTADESSVIGKTYSECKNVSIDYGVMEKADNVYVLCSDFGWSDLGTWGSLYEHSDKDEKGNTAGGEIVNLYEVNNTIVRSEAGKTVVVQGLDDYIVVDSEKVLLICKKEEEQRIKQFVNDITVEKKK